MHSVWCDPPLLPTRLEAQCGWEEKGKTLKQLEPLKMARPCPYLGEKNIATVTPDL